MAKLTLNTIGSRYGSIDALNDNFDAIEAAIENTFSLDGTGPNALEADLDMNSNEILNAGAIHTDSLYINGRAVAPSTGVVNATPFAAFFFTATSGQTTFSIAPYTVSSASVKVVVNGLQLPASSISVNSTNVVLSALQTGDEVTIDVFVEDVAAFAAVFPYEFTSTSGQTTFTTGASLVPNGVEVFVDGLLLPPSGYSISGSSVILPPLSAGQEILVKTYTTATSLVQSTDSIPYTASGGTTRTLSSKLAEVVSVKDFGAICDGVTNDYAALVAAQQAVLNTGGTILVPGICAFSTPLVLKSGVNWIFSSKAKLLWTGSVSAICVETDSTTVYKDVRWNGFTVDTGASFTGTGLRIHSAHNISADVVTLITTGTTSKALVLVADSSGGETSLTKRNITAVNIGRLVHQGQCGTLLECSGVQAGYDATPQVVTLNTIGAIFGENCAVYGINLINWTDNNCFPGMNRVMINANSGVGLQVSGTNGTLNQGVYANQFGIVAVDTFGTFVSRIGVQLGFSKLTQIRGLYQNPLAEGGPFIVDNLTQSYDVTYIRDSDGAFIQYKRGEFYATNYGFNSTQGALLTDDSAVGIDVRDYGTNENITFMLTVATDDANANGVVWCKVRRSTGTAAISLVAGGANIAVRTGAMTGTTGTDTKLNISTHNDGKFYIENRLGTSVYVSYHIAARLQTP